MGASRLSPRSVRRIARSTGLDVVFAWSHHTYWHNFCTRDHRHGWWNCRSHEWEWDDGDPRWPLHYPDCYEWFDRDGSLTLQTQLRIIANRMLDPTPRSQRWNRAAGPPSSEHNGQCDFCQPPRRMTIDDLYDHVHAEHPAAATAMQQPATYSLLVIPPEP